MFTWYEMKTTRLRLFEILILWNDVNVNGINNYTYTIGLINDLGIVGINLGFASL